AQDARRRLIEKLLAQSTFNVPFYAVVTRCLRDVVAQHYRWQQRHGTDLLDDEERAAHAGQGMDPAERSMDPRADRRILRMALTGLGEPDAQIVFMKIILDLPAREIGERLGLTEVNVNTRFSRALPRLAQLVREAVRKRQDSAEDQT